MIQPKCYPYQYLYHWQHCNWNLKFEGKVYRTLPLIINMQCGNSQNSFGMQVNTSKPYPNCYLTEAILGRISFIFVSPSRSCLITFSTHHSWKTAFLSSFFLVPYISWQIVWLVDKGASLYIFVYETPLFSYFHMISYPSTIWLLFMVMQQKRSSWRCAMSVDISLLILFSLAQLVSLIYWP